MANTAKRVAANRRSTTAAERTVVYRGIKIAPIAGKRSPTAQAIRDALRTKPEVAGGEPAHG